VGRYASSVVHFPAEMGFRTSREITADGLITQRSQVRDPPPIAASYSATGEIFARQRGLGGLVFGLISLRSPTFIDIRIYASIQARTSTVFSELLSSLLKIGRSAVRPRTWPHC
jgi:hypothetical protein